MRAIGRYLHANMLGALALFVALGGTGYAAIAIPRNSVGSQQLRNHSITPAKFDRRFINGNIRAWVVANANGTVQTGIGKPSVQLIGNPGNYLVQWKKIAALSQRGCFAMTGLTSGDGPGFTTEGFHARSRPRQPAGVYVATYDAQGQPLAESFYAAVVC
jgi:hypothetical protein